MYRPREEGPSRAKNIPDEDIRAAIESYDQTLSAAQAYVEEIRKQLLAGRGWRFDQPETIYPYIQAANLPLKIEIQSALSKAWAASSYARCAAYDEMILDEAHAGGYVDLSSSQLFFGIIQRLGQQQGWTVNERRAAELALASEESTRQRLINEATEGTDYYRVVEFGQVRAKPKTQLLGLNIEQLREVVSLVEQRRMAENRSVEQQRIDLRVATNAARGYSVPRAGDRDSLAAESTASTSAHRGALPSLSPEIENLFTDPGTGEFYTSLALKKLFTTQPRLIRTMMKADLNFMNRLLQGEQ